MISIFSKRKSGLVNAIALALLAAGGQAVADNGPVAKQLSGGPSDFASMQAADPTDAQAMRGMLAAEGALGAGLGRLLAISESYPQLKADATMAQLKEELASTENRIAFARQAYNDAVMVYNTGCEQMPASIIANAAGFRPATPYEIDDSTHRNAPVVSFAKT